MKTTGNYSKALFILTVATLLYITSCGTGPEPPEPALDPILGKWTATEGVTEISYQGMSAYDYWISQGATPEEAAYTVGYQTRGHGDYIPFSIDFKPDGTYMSLSGAVGDQTGYENTGTWELSADRKTLSFFDMEVAVLTSTENALSLQFVFDSDEYSQELMTYKITLTYTS